MHRLGAYMENTHGGPLVELGLLRGRFEQLCRAPFQEECDELEQQHQLRHRELGLDVQDAVEDTKPAVHFRASEGRDVQWLQSEHDAGVLLPVELQRLVQQHQVELLQVGRVLQLLELYLQQHVQEDVQELLEQLGQLCHWYQNLVAEWRRYLVAEWRLYARARGFAGRCRGAVLGSGIRGQAMGTN